MTVHRLSDNHEYALDLKWLPPGVVSVSASESRKGKELQTLSPPPKVYTQLQSDIGIQLGASVDGAAIGLPSAAAQFAKVYSAGILIERLTDDLFWLCVTEDGAIFPSGDMVGNRDVISVRIAEILHDFSGRKIQIFDKHQDFVEEHKSTAKNFADLTQNLVFEDSIQCQNVYVRSLRIPIISVISSVILAVCVYFGWNYFNSLEIDEQTSKAQSLLEEKATKLAKERQLIVDSLAQDSSILLSSFSDLASSRPRYLGGWQLKKVSCDGKTCKAIWQRRHGQIADLLQHLGTVNTILDEQSGTIFETLLLSEEIQSRKVNLESDLGNPNQRYQMLDQLALLPGTWSISESTPSGSEFPIRISSVKGASERFSELINVANLLGNHPFVIQEISADITPKFKWSLSAKYYEQDS